MLHVYVFVCSTGLWMADLVVTQLLQENVQEMERGIVNGVQHSLNRLMDMLKFILVICLPAIETYGILILLSFLFICIAGCFFAYHSWRVRGHLFHFNKMCGACKNNNNTLTVANHCEHPEQDDTENKNKKTSEFDSETSRSCDSPLPV